MSADASTPLQSSEYRPCRVNDECSEDIAPIPGARMGMQYANVTSQMWSNKHH